MNEMRHWLR